MRARRIGTYNRDDTKKGDQLVQALVTTTATSVLSPAANEEIEVTKIVVSNYSNQNRYVNIYHDKDGTTYDGTTSIAFRRTVNSNSDPYTKEGAFFMRGTGNLAVEAESNTALTVTVYGYRRALT